MPVNPPKIGRDLELWGTQLNIFLQRSLGKIFFKTSDDNPSENGIFLWDDNAGYPVVSSDDAFVQVVMKRAAPTANTGSSGDKDGMISWDDDYIYICTADYDGTTAIWKRVALAAWT